MSPSGVGIPFAGLSLGGAVPLSDHEQRQLDQIERALYAEDPKFVSAVRSTDPKVHYKRRIWKAAIGFVLGLIVVMAGPILNTMPISIVISVAGFLLMVFCCAWGLTSWKRMTGIGAEPDPRKRSPKPSRGPKSSFMERMEERWRRRHEGP
ncbi:membrane protein [Actinoallomurus iriomotensis]|uniref:Membrane protein n=1 Tax=Actinoallomurus iriomotensis TaxID=478107 RepID=A0A9W6VMV6_9ACTN|nr:membrane protein [Actinoallomurus iriomotensis]